MEIDGKEVSNLRVVDLRVELQKRGLSRAGSKKDMVERLTKALKEEKSAKPEVNDEPSEQDRDERERPEHEPTEQEEAGLEAKTENLEDEERKKLEEIEEKDQLETEEEKQQGSSASPSDNVDESDDDAIVVNLSEVISEGDEDPFSVGQEKPDKSTVEEQKSEHEASKVSVDVSEENLVKVGEEPIRFRRLSRKSESSSHPKESKRTSWSSLPQNRSDATCLVSSNQLKDIVPDIRPFVEDLEEENPDESEDEVAADEEMEEVEKNDPKSGSILPETFPDVVKNGECHNTDDPDVLENEDSSLSNPIVKKASVNKFSEANSAKSCVVSIKNLIRPFTLAQLRELLKRTGKIVEQGFWTDQIKSHAIVQYSSHEEAEETVAALDDIRWPSCNPEKLAVTFTTEEVLLEAQKSAPMSPPESVADDARRKILSERRMPINEFHSRDRYNNEEKILVEGKRLYNENDENFSAEISRDNENRFHRQYRNGDHGRQRDRDYDRNHGDSYAQHHRGGQSHHREDRRSHYRDRTEGHGHFRDTRNLQRQDHESGQSRQFSRNYDYNHHRKHDDGYGHQRDVGQSHHREDHRRQHRDGIIGRDHLRDVRNFRRQDHDNGQSGRYNRKHDHKYDHHRDVGQSLHREDRHSQHRDRDDGRSHLRNVGHRQDNADGYNPHHDDGRGHLRNVGHRQDNADGYNPPHPHRDSKRQCLEVEKPKDPPIRKTKTRPSITWQMKMSPEKKTGK